MVGVGEDNLCLDVFAQVAMEDALDRCGRTYGHKYGCLDGAVGGLYEARARLALGVFFLKCEFHTRQS